MVDKSSKKKNDNYIPGVINLSKKDAHQRMLLGMVGIIFTLIIFILMILKGSGEFIFLLLFFPIMLTVMSINQGDQRFCIQYGFEGIHSSNKNNTENVKDHKKHAKDRNTAWRMLMFSILVSLILTVLINILIRL